MNDRDSILFRLDAAIEAARGSGRLLLERSFSEITVELKGKNDVVTELDGAVERFIIDHMRVRFPHDNFLGEELGEARHGDGGRWIIDPIDGTENFSRSIPNYTISIGYEDARGVPMLGVVYNPRQDELFHALRGGGAFLNGHPIRVSGVREPGAALSIVAPPIRMHHKAPAYFRLMQTIFLQTRDLRDFGSAALDLCYVACGRAEAHYQFGLKHHDIAAGLVILTEAGGAYAGMRDGENVFETGNLIATNGHLQSWYREKIRASLGY